MSLGRATDKAVHLSPLGTPGEQLKRWSALSSTRLKRLGVKPLHPRSRVAAYSIVAGVGDPGTGLNEASHI
jgi:hypothetical protein